MRAASAKTPPQAACPPVRATPATTYGDYNYGGACPPPGHGTHRYIFTIHALDCEYLDLPEDTTTARVGFNVWAHSLGSASLTGTFSR